jgi:acyl carrier protein
MKRTREQILGDVVELLRSVVRDSELDASIDAHTRLHADLAFESLDLVVLGAAVQEHFGRTFPFPELFAEVGQREIRDLTVGEWVDFLHRHFRDDVGAAGNPPALPEEERV